MKVGDWVALVMLISLVAGCVVGAWHTSNLVDAQWQIDRADFENLLLTHGVEVEDGYVSSPSVIVPVDEQVFLEMVETYRAEDVYREVWTDHISYYVFEPNMEKAFKYALDKPQQIAEEATNQVAAIIIGLAVAAVAGFLFAVRLGGFRRKGDEQ